ncbi:MAG: hypothetical protein AW07_04014 [Candidatus Accumulibacter sp. SK-11]|nr:MAG: hypothetical protein AW07_04014 [Candidatus Accumulibacter sp. SK-11]
MAVTRQCVLAAVCHAALYAQQKQVAVDESDLLHGCLIDEGYIRHPFYGSRAIFPESESHGSNPECESVRRFTLGCGVKPPKHCATYTHRCPTCILSHHPGWPDHAQRCRGWLTAWSTTFQNCSRVASSAGVPVRG